MKTIVITSFHPLLSRNILRTGILESVAKDNQVIILAPDYKKDYFEKEFASENVSIVVVPKKPLRGIVGALFGIGALLLPVSTMVLKRKEKFAEDKNIISFLMSLFFLKIIARMLGIVRAYRFLFGAFYNEHFFKEFLSNTRPDLIFATDILEINDIRLIMEAHKLNIPTIGMVRSWDNLTNKGILPVVPDSIIVNNEIIAKELIELHKVKKITVHYELRSSASALPQRRCVERDGANTSQKFSRSLWCVSSGQTRAKSCVIGSITIVGMPQFDYYIGYKPTPKEVFFNKLGFDPSRKVIMFAPMGSKFIESDWSILQILHDAILDGSIKGKPNLLVRFPPGDGIEHLSRVKISPDVRVFQDRPGVGFKVDEKKDKELNREDMIHLADSLYYSDVLVNAGSSLCIDIAAFDKPIVFPAFDGLEYMRYAHIADSRGLDADRRGNVNISIQEHVPYLKSVKKLFQYHHYRYLLRTKACHLARSKQELIEWINTYLDNPSLDSDKRKKLIEEQCWKHDGRAAERISIYLRELLAL